MWWHKHAVTLQKAQTAFRHVNQSICPVLSYALNILMGYISICSHVTDIFNDNLTK